MDRPLFVQMIESIENIAGCCNRLLDLEVTAAAEIDSRRMSLPGDVVAPGRSSEPGTE
jgi:hypothetical protein